MRSRRSAASALVLAVGTLAVSMGLIAAVARRFRHPPLDVVAGFDLERYLGTWYEIARTPAWYERGCQDTTAHYSLQRDGSIEVVNRCQRRAGTSEVRGRAWVPDAAVPARLTVQFRWPFRGDYEVIYVDGDYHVALVGSRDRRHAWILCREPHLDEETYQLCCDFLAEQGFDPGRLIRTPHPSSSKPTGRRRILRPTASATPA